MSWLYRSVGMRFRIFLTLILLSLDLISRRDAQAFNSVDQLLNQVQHINQIQADCGTRVEKPSSKKTYPSAKLEGSDISVSVLSIEELNVFFNEMKDNKSIPFGFPEDGCYARAHKMALLLEERGVISGKAFIEGALQVINKNNPNETLHWSYHVAPVVLVKMGGKFIPYAIDPSIFDKPVPISTWTGIQTCNSVECKNDFFYTKRFNYQPSSRNKKMTSYDVDELNKLETELKIYKIFEDAKIREARIPQGSSD